MTLMVLVLLGLIAGLVAALLVFAGACLRVPPAQARRAGLAAMLGGTIGFTLTAATQLPFYDGGDIAGLGVPLAVACAAGAAGAVLAAWMILRAGSARRDPIAPAPEE
jgi:hypothetical protein